MNSLKIFCLSLNPDHLHSIQKLSYIPVGLGKHTLEMNGCKIKKEIILQIKTKLWRVHFSLLVMEKLFKKSIKTGLVFANIENF